MAIPADKIDQAIAQLGQAGAAQAVDPAVGLMVIKVLNALGYELRVFIDTSNGGGHQTTTMNILKRFIDYGFTAPIRIFYDTVATLEMFLPGYTKNMKKMTYRGVTLNFQAAEGSKKPDEKVPLLICGGSEATESRRKQRLRDTNCCFYLQLQPWAWKSIDYLVYSPPKNPSDPTSCDPTANVKEIVLGLQEDLGKSRFTFSAYAQPAPVRDPSVWSQYAANARFTAVVAMANLLADYAPHAWTMPVYGLVTWKYFINLALAAVSAQAKMPERGLQSKPVVLLSFGGLLDQSDDVPLPGGAQLEQWLTGAAQYGAEFKALKDYIAGLNQGGSRFTVHYQKNPALLQQQLQALPANGVLVVSLGSTPNEVFNYLYAQASLPLVFEGRGTLNLALNLGKPYICTTHSASGGYPGLNLDDKPPLAGTEAAATAGLVQSSINQYEDNAPTPWPPSKIADGVLKMLTDPGSQNYFQALASVYGAEANDRLLKALRFCKSIQGFPG